MCALVGKVESGVGHAQRTPLKGLRFESLEDAQSYLDRWEQNWADSRIHGTTKRQVRLCLPRRSPPCCPCPSSPSATTSTFIARHEDGLFLGPPGTVKSHLAQAIGQAAIQQAYRVLYRETHTLLDELAEATLDGTRKEYLDSLVAVPLLILDDFGMRKLPLTAAEELLEIIMRRYERASTLLTRRIRTYREITED